MKPVFSFFLRLGLVLLAVAPAWAGSGKIAGWVHDENGEAVIGASVQIVQTQQGAAVGIDGNYVVLGVSAGTYTVRITCVGYAAKTFTDVQINSDLTTTLNATLAEEAIGIQEQVVEYVAPTVKLDVSSKEMRVTGKEMQTRAVQDISNLLQKTPGFKVDPEGQIHVRGGRAHEMLMKVDGVDFRDPLVEGARQIVNLSVMNVEEIEVLTGGDARYGGFQSALVNVTTPEGSMTDYSGALEWRTDRAFKKADPFSRYLKSHPLLDASFGTDRYDYSVSGPVPFVNQLLGGQKLSFFTSGMARLTNTYTPFRVHRSPNDYLGVGLDVPERQNNDFQTFWKLTYRVDQTKKLNFTWQRTVSKWDIYPDGDVVSGDYGYRYKYDVANRPFAKSRTTAMNLAFSHNISKTTLYEVSLGNVRSVTQVQPRNKNPDQFTLTNQAEDVNRQVAGSIDTDNNGYLDGYLDANRNGVYDGSGEGYDDANSNGQWDRGEDWVDLDGDGVYDQAEPFVDRPNAQGVNNIGVFDPWDPYVDLNGNGRWDPAEPQLAEQDWNHNGQWDGERFQDANHNGRYDGWGEGYDDRNTNGSIDKRQLSSDAQDVGEPFIDGDYWFDTGEPFVDSPDSTGYYDGVWSAGEIWYDMPSSYAGPYVPRGVPTTNGRYDGPNEAFDEYELFTFPAFLEYGMDPRYPVLYTWEDIRQGIRNPRGWLVYDETGFPAYLRFNANPCPWDPSRTISTWTNATLYDAGARSHWVFDIPDGIWQPGREQFQDYNGNGVEDPLPDKFLNPGLWDDQAFWEQRETREWSGKVDLTSQVNKYHEIKTGVEIKQRYLAMQSIQYPGELYTNTDIPLPPGAPYPGRGGIRDFYEHKPWEGAVYFQDKMEFEGMILRAGLRSDFVIQPNALLEETQQQLDRQQPGALLAKRGRFVLAPRLGISHPISTRSKLYFNYGHYYQTPTFEHYYQSATANLSPNTLVGNPNLEYEKTVSYEVGVNTEFTEDWVVDVAGYYRDVFNQIGTVEFRDGPLVLNRYFNLGYARARGFEFSLEKKPSNMWAFTLNYDYSYAYGKESAAAEGLLQRTSNVPENRDEHPLGWDQTHTVSAYLTMQASEKDKPRPFGVRIPNNWLTTVEFTYGSGYPYTPSKYVTQTDENLILANSARFPNTVAVDLKFDKFWNITKRIKLTTGFEIYNLLDRRNIRALYAETGNAYDSTHMLNQTARPDGNQGTDWDHNPRNYAAPRQILFHFKVSA